MVINEIMYNPISLDSDDEYIELLQPRRAAGGPGRLAVRGRRRLHLPRQRDPRGRRLSGRGPERRAAADQLPAAQRGEHASATTPVRWRNGGERLALAKPDLVVTTNALGVPITNRIHIVVSEVTYADGRRWGRGADGGGSSLELIDPDADLLRAVELGRQR